jgi:N-acetyl sugar amidotransferase
MIHYCTRCIMPDTKPDLTFDEEGVCSACRYYEQRAQVDWPARKAELSALLDKYRSTTHYDCIVPVSGGKDSHAQVIAMLERDMHPLAVCATTCALSDLGRRNLDNLKGLGVDCIEFTTNPVVRRKLNRIGLEQVGDISWPEHAAIFTIPVRAAVAYNVPLIIWGENSQREYGGPAAAADKTTLDRAWLDEFGGLLGLRPSDMVGQDGITARDMLPFQYPSDDELARVGVTGLFLGHYLPWDGRDNAHTAAQRGFRRSPTRVEGTGVNYENLDNVQTGIHDYLKFCKYGYGRATDIACMDVRRGYCTRDTAAVVAMVHEGDVPTTYLGVPIQEVLDEIGISLDKFSSICDEFTNRALFKCEEDGSLYGGRRGQLRKVNYP